MTIADFWRVYAAIRKHIWVTALVVITTSVVVLVGWMLLPRYYQATATLLPTEQALNRMPARGATGVLAGDEGMGGPEGRHARLLDLRALLSSRTLVDRVAQTLELGVSPDTLRKSVEIGVVTSQENEPTSLLSITAFNPQAEVAVALARTYADEFVKFYQEIGRADAREARAFLESRLMSAQGELQLAEGRLARFRRAHPESTASSATAAAAPSDAVLTERDDTEATLLATRAQAAALRAQLRHTSAVQAVEEGTTKSPKVVALEAELATLEKDLLLARATRTSSHPEVVELENKIRNLRRELDAEKNKITKYTNYVSNPAYFDLTQQLSKLEGEVAALTAKLRGLDSAVARSRERKSEAAGSDVVLGALLREQKLAEDRYSSLMTATNQARLNESSSRKEGAITVVDRPGYAIGPVARNKSLPQLMVLAIVLSVVVGVGLALGLEFLDNRVRTSVDAQKLYELPITGIIPSLTGDHRALPLVTYLRPLAPVSEAYRFLRTDVLFTARQQPLRTIMVATPKPGQGGTATICNLAISLAQAGKKVILVDADLRRPSLHKFFSTSNDVGLTDVLRNGTPAMSTLKRTWLEDLLLMPAGQAVTNPSELIGSRRMREVLEELKGYGDFVLFDTPSAMAFTDAAVLSAIVDGVLLVVRAQQAPRGTEVQVKDLLNKAGANVIGVVLNDVEPETVDSYYYHSHYYGSSSQAEGPDPSGSRSLAAAEERGRALSAGEAQDA